MNLSFNFLLLQDRGTNIVFPEKITTPSGERTNLVNNNNSSNNKYSNRDHRSPSVDKSVSVNEKSVNSVISEKSANGSDMFKVPEPPRRTSSKDDFMVEKEEVVKGDSSLGSTLVSESITSWFGSSGLFYAISYDSPRSYAY